MNTEKDIIYWDCEESEILTHTDIDEAVEYFLENIEIKDWPEITEVSGYAKLKISESEKARYAERILENLLEDLDEEYGGEDYTEPSDKMKEAAKRFMDEFVNEYQVWRCWPEVTEKVNTMEWVKKNRPDWLEGN